MHGAVLPSLPWAICFLSFFRDVHLTPSLPWVVCFLSFFLDHGRIRGGTWSGNSLGAAAADRWMLLITRNTVTHLPSQWCLKISGTPGRMHSHNGVPMFGSVRAVPSGPEPSRAVPSGPERSRAVPSGPRAPQSLPESPRPLGRHLRRACFL